MIKPIIFSGPMVRAILDGRKTQTRRVFKVTDPLGKKHPITSPSESIEQFDDGTFHYMSTGGMSGPYPCPYGHDKLWVRETFATTDPESEILYAADFSPAQLKEERALRRQFPGIAEDFPGGAWKPSIHMPRWASRITLEIKSVRVERVQEISREDCRAEGVGLPPSPGDTTFYPGMDELRSQFAGLWDSINKKKGYGWDANPWVWVIEFKRVEA